MDTVTLTREKLYALVWSKPMTAVAEDFGVSSVAFAKHCQKLGIPRPSRGYWQQLAAGLKPRPERLPKSKPGTPAEVTLVKHERSERKLRDLPDAPTVVLAEKLTRPHPIVSQIRERKHPMRPDDHKMSGVRGTGHPVLKVGAETERRALLILDALLKALEARGHELELRDRSDYGPHRFALEAKIGKERVEFWLMEHAERKPHVSSAAELAELAKYSWRTAPKYDFTPSGRLILEATWTGEDAVRRRWADTKTQRIEDLLGEIVVGLEVIAATLAEQRLQREAELLEEKRRREEEERKRRRAAHREALANHLVKAANRWREAQTARAFLKALGRRLPRKRRSPDFERWFTWAGKYVGSHDPLGDPESVARPLEPDATPTL